MNVTRVERYNPYSLFVVVVAFVVVVVVVVVVVRGCLCVCLLLLLLLLGGGGREFNPHVNVFVVDVSYFCTIRFISCGCIPEYRPIRYFRGFGFRDIFQL